MTWPISSMLQTAFFPSRTFHNATPLPRSVPPSLIRATGSPAAAKIWVSALATVSPSVRSVTHSPMHSQSSSWIALPRRAKASMGTLNTTRAFFTPMSMDRSMIASHGLLIRPTWLSLANPNRTVQLITDVKCGTQRSDTCSNSRSKSRIRGTARKETTACTTNTIHTRRVCVASSMPTTLLGRELGFFFRQQLLFEAGNTLLKKLNSSLLPRFGLPELSELLCATGGLPFPAIAAAAHAG